MISSVKGRVTAIGRDYLVVDVGGVGLKVHVPTGTLSQASPGRTAELFTHLHVRENELALYGFASEEELDFFELLLGVAGVGPRVALNILSKVPADALRQAIAQEQVEFLARVPGIGPKTAKKIVFHLKDKVRAEAGVAVTPVLSEADAELIAALTSLGYSVVEAQAALQTLPRDEALSIEERIRLALMYFAG
ncbi:MAG: Holliday junction branch migration protein RuvA [Anaerolineae bacterium]|jgi:Holliday junction DNA helicase RuvA|nr:Holliday junction branch migration protein RuvA [Anaerolineae bacterium]MDH7472507.1 Holliday junction branch migration protein RuvA [Anaerolineae bacterium]